MKTMPEDRVSADRMTQIEYRGGRAQVPSVIDDLMATGVLLPEQMPSATAAWSPEKHLAAAVLAAALTEIRVHSGKRAYLRRVAQTLAWIQSSDTEWPFSFLPLCALFGLDPGWVRARVESWMSSPRDRRAPRGTPFRRAA